MDEAAFDSSWLALREPMDGRSRADSLLVPLREAWHTHGWHRILDLGSGTGSNLRHLAPRLPNGQEWILLDRDVALLSQVRLPDASPPVALAPGDLGKEGIAAVAQADLVTASALLDLVSTEWLGSLVDACRAGGCGVLCTLTYDGRIEWSPASSESSGNPVERTAESNAPDDELVRVAVNAHQTRDKGLGPALGPSAAPEAERLFREAGYRTWIVPSPWRLGPGDTALSRALITGWRDAAVEERPEATERVRAWAIRRHRDVADSGFSLEVGHLDLLALPDR